MGFINQDCDLVSGKILFGDEKNIFEARPAKRPFYREGSLKA
jgi:hypothetical protein